MAEQKENVIYSFFDSEAAGLEAQQAVIEKEIEELADQIERARDMLEIAKGVWKDENNSYSDEYLAMRRSIHERVKKLHLEIQDKRFDQSALREHVSFLEDEAKELDKLMENKKPAGGMSN